MCWKSMTKKTCTVKAQESHSKTSDLEKVQLLCVLCQSILPKLTHHPIFTVWKPWTHTGYFCQVLSKRKQQYASVSFCPMQRKIKIVSLAVKSWRNRVLQTNLRFQMAEHSVPEPQDKSSVSFHSFKRRAECWQGFEEESKNRGRWEKDVQERGVIQIHQSQSAKMHTEVHTMRGQKVSSVCPV